MWAVSCVYFDQILALAPLEPWSSCAVVLGLSCCITRPNFGLRSTEVWK